MLHRIAVIGTEALKSRGIISAEREKVYIYGLELMCSFLGSITCMLIMGAFLGCVKELVIFLLCFIPVRMTAGGYHAKSYGSCIVWSNAIVLGSTWSASFMAARIPIGFGWIAAAVALYGILYIWYQAPVLSHKAPQRMEILRRNKKFTHFLLCMIYLCMIVMQMWERVSYVYAMAFAMGIVAVMIRISRKGE